jgi:hypothetical protein
MPRKINHQPIDSLDGLESQISETTEPIDTKRRASLLHLRYTNGEDVYRPRAGRLIMSN